MRFQPNTLIQDAWVDGSQVALPGYFSQMVFLTTLSSPMILTLQLHAGPYISI
jgi:hypothetical protein